MEEKHLDNRNSYAIFNQIIEYICNNGIVVLVNSKIHDKLIKARNNNEDLFSLDNNEIILTRLERKKKLICKKKPKIRKK